MKDIVITPADRAKWMKEEEDVLLQITKLQSRLLNIRRKRELADLVSNGDAEAEALDQRGSDFSLQPTPLAEESFGAALERIAKSASEPISKAELKKRLARAGHDKGNTPQFYTTLKRLKDKTRIAVLPDGRVWKP